MATTYPQAVILGDSLIEGSVQILDGFSWFSAVQSHFIRRLDVVNRGLSGYNTQNVLDHFDRLFAEPGPQTPEIKYLLILLGANDAVVPLETVFQFVPIDKYKENLGKIINHPRIAAHKPTILLVTPPPVDEIKLTRLDTAQGHPSATRTAEKTARYAEVAREVAREHPGVVLVDLWKAVMARAIERTPGGWPSEGPLLGSLGSGTQGGLDELLPDGLHMGSTAYKVFWDEVLPHFGGERDPEDRSGYQVPEWRALEPTHPSL